jgi:MFS family permease
MSDRVILYSAAFVRSLATGMIGVLMGVFMAHLDFDLARIGSVVGAGLFGCATAALVVTLIGDNIGRKRSLLVLSLLAACGGLGFALTAHPFAAGAAAFLGMVNGMGRDRGASLILDQVILPATVDDAGRTQAFAWYNVLQDIGHALGALLAGLPALLRSLGVANITSFRAGVGVYALLMLVTTVLYLGLSPRVERATGGPKTQVTPQTRRVLWRIASLFAFDSLAGGFLTTALLTLFFYERFSVGEGILGPLFFGARIFNAASHLGAAWLSRRIGLVNTMVFTHVPSSLLLVTVAFAPNFTVAAILFLLREGLVEMDVPTRQSYVMAVVRPEERTLASGVTHLVRVGAWAIAPSFAGWFMTGWSLMTPLVVGSVMKIAYDVLLFAAFRRTRPPEED